MSLPSDPKMEGGNPPPKFSRKELSSRIGSYHKYFSRFYSSSSKEGGEKGSSALTLPEIKIVHPLSTETLVLSPAELDSWWEEPPFPKAWESTLERLLQKILPPLLTSVLSTTLPEILEAHRETFLFWNQEEEEDFEEQEPEDLEGEMSYEQILQAQSPERSFPRIFQPFFHQESYRTLESTFSWMEDHRGILQVGLAGYLPEVPKIYPWGTEEIAQEVPEKTIELSFESEDRTGTMQGKWKNEGHHRPVIEILSCRDDATGNSIDFWDIDLPLVVRWEGPIF